jgi:ketosteroid isomerase-like protein
VAGALGEERAVGKVEVAVSSRYAWLLAVMMVFPTGGVGTDRPALTAQQQDVLKVSDAWRDAFNHRDPERFAHYIADDFIGSTDDGIFMTKASLLKRLTTHSPEEEQRSDVRDIRARVNGDLAVVNYLVTVSEGGFQPKELSFQFRRTEFLQKKNGNWLAIAAHESQLPINHRVPVTIDPRTLKDYEGQYTFRPGFSATYTVEGGHLIDEWKGEKTEALPMAKDTFFEREDLGWTTLFETSKAGSRATYTTTPTGSKPPERRSSSQGGSHENQSETSRTHLHSCGRGRRCTRA